MEQRDGDEMLQKGKNEWTAAEAGPEGPVVDVVGCRCPGQPEGAAVFWWAGSRRDKQGRGTWKRSPTSA